MQGLDKAFEALKTYDVGAGRASIMPIDDAVVASLTDTATRKQLERRLIGVLQTGGSKVAKEYVCSQLRRIGEAESVPALVALLADPALAQAACNALESIACPEAARAIRERLPTLKGLTKAAAITALARRRDAQDVSVLAPLLNDGDVQVSAAAVAALGEIGTNEAAQVLLKYQANVPASVRLAVADALLACAERLLADGKKAEALAVYRTLANPQQPSHVRSAAERGAAMAGKGQ
jgi:HEAT repeat protein